MPANPFANGLRLSPSGPYMPWAILANYLNQYLLTGQVARAWCAEQGGTPPGYGGVALPAGVETTVDNIAIVCDATQLGRAYLIWQALTVYPPNGAQDPETQPTAVLLGTGVAPAMSPGFYDIMQAPIPSGLRFVVHGEGDLFPWQAYGCNFAMYLSGVNGPPFVVGTNHIRMAAVCIGQDGFAPAAYSRHMILELTGDLSNYTPTTASEGGGAI